MIGLPYTRVIFAIALLLSAAFPIAAEAADEDDSSRSEATETSATTWPRRNPLNGPDSADSLIEEFQEDKADVLGKNLLQRWEERKADLSSRTGLGLGADYTSAGFAATSSPGDDTAASGIARVFASWALLNRGGANTGSFEFKVEHRHAYTDVPPQLFGFEVGYAGTPQPVFNDAGFLTTELYWKQSLQDGKAVARAGFVDMKQYLNLNPLVSPWSGFHNLAFSTGSNTMAVLPDGAFGAMFGQYLSANSYVVAGIADASANPASVFDGFDTFFGDFDTLKTLEFGITGGGDRLFVDNAHVAIWHLDESKENGTPGGHGVNVSLSTLLEGRWLPFLRAAWADEGGGIYESSISAGFGFMNRPGGNLLGGG